MAALLDRRLALNASATLLPRPLFLALAQAGPDQQGLQTGFSSAPTRVGLLASSIPVMQFMRIS